jgi:putative MATE family efflux protein
MIVGNYLGETSLAAIGAGSPIYDLMVGFAFGMGNGMSLVAGRSFGSGDRNKLKKSVAAAIVLGTIVAVVITVIAQLLTSPLLKALNTPDEILAESKSYVSTITLFIIVMLAYNLCSGILRAVGNSVMPLVFLIISSLLNVGLDILFITQFGMGIRGAAIATVIAQGVSVVLCIIYIVKYNQMLVPRKEHFHLEKDMCREMISQGIAMGCMSGIVQAGSAILQSGINGLGYLIIAGHTAARKVYMCCNIMFSSMAHAISSFVSQNRGAEQPARIRRAMRDIIIYDICMACVITVFLFLAAPTLIRLISGSTEEVILTNGSRYLRVVAPFYAILGMVLSFRFALQAMGRKILPLFSSVIELIGKMLFAWLMIPRFGYMAVIFCEPAIWCFMVVELLISFYTNPYIKDAYKKTA